MLGDVTRGDVPRDLPGLVLADAPALRDAALAHLARFAATEAGLLQVLKRRLSRLGRRALQAGAPGETVAAAEAAGVAVAREVVGELVRIRAVDDAAFAESRARALLRAGRSRRAVRAGLAERGVQAELAQAALERTQQGADQDKGAESGDRLDTELAAALVHARRRRLGPFAPNEAGSEPEDGEAGGEDERRRLRLRALASLARAGFTAAVAVQALATDFETAEEMIERLRRL